MKLNKRLFFFLGFLFFTNYSLGQDTSSSFRFVFQEIDAYSHGLGGADLVNFSSGALFQNFSSAVFNKNQYEGTASYLVQPFVDNRIALYGFGSLGVHRLGGKVVYVFATDDFVNGQNLPYMGIHAGLAYAISINDLSKKLKTPISIGVTMNYANETIFGNAEHAFLMDLGITTVVAKNRLFISVSANNIGYSTGDATIPYSLRAGIKYEWSGFKKNRFLRNLEMLPMLKYSFDADFVNSIAIGWDTVFFRKYSIRVGGNFNFLAGGLSVLTNLNFGIGFKLPFLEIDLSYQPGLNSAHQIMTTLKYYYPLKKEFKRLSINAIVRLSIEEIIKLAKEAIIEKEYNYAGLLVKQGLIRMPNHNELLDLLDKASDLINE